MKPYLNLALTVLLLGSGLTGCAAVRQHLGTVLVPQKTEIELGEKMAAQIEAREKVHPDRRLQAYIRQIAEPLVRHSLADRPGITYAITVLDNPEQVNAFAVPGGFLYLYTGLLLLAENEAEVAGVLAHEVGHVVGRHSANQLAAQYGLAVLTSVALGDQPEEIARMTEQFSAGAQAFFSRDDEREADEYGAKYLIAAGYDPRGLLTFFQKIKRLERGKRSGLDNLMASHPATEERIQRLEKMIWQAGSPKGRTEEERFARETAALRRGW